MATGAAPAGGSGVYPKFSTTWQSGPHGCDQLSARVMCSDDGIALIRVAGEVDYCTAPVLALAVNEALREGASEVFVDLAQVSFFGAAGASALVVARRQCQRWGAGFAILRPSRATLRVLSFTDLVGPQPQGHVIDLTDERRQGQSTVSGSFTGIYGGPGSGVPAFSATWITEQSNPGVG